METVDRLKQKFPGLQSPPSDDICYATQNRQAAVKVIAPEVELFLVVGSANSSNSVRMVEVAAWLADHGYTDMQEVSHTEERLTFALPQELRRDLRTARR